eukprot:8897323-Pyramimonas_sp.AAC.1
MVTRPFWQTPHTFRGPTGSSTEGVSGWVHMVPCPTSALPSRVSWSIGSSTEGVSDCVRMAPPRSFWLSPHMFRGPIGSSTEGHSG